MPEHATSGGGMIFLTGSTGFVGQNLLPFLKELGLPVRCFIRRNSHTECLKNFCEDKVIGDVLDESSLRYSMRGVDTVIHLAGVRTDIGGASFESIFYLGTRHAIDVAKSLGIRKFILLSAGGARSESKSKYLHYKWMSEEYLKHSGLKYTILRPTLIYGPHDHFVTRWIKKLKALPIIPILGSGDNLLQPISVGDVVRCILQCLKDESKDGGIYNLGGPDRLTFEKIIRMIEELMGLKRRLFHWPLSLVRPFAYFCEALLPHPPFTPDELARWMEDRTCDHQSVEKSFNFKLQPFAEGLRHYFGPFASKS